MFSMMAAKRRGRKVSGPADKEREIREKLEFFSSAAKVLVFAESSYWDPDWLLTSDEYYDCA